MTARPSVAMTQPRYQGRGGANDSRWLARYQDWQPWARRYARQIGAAGFNATVISDLCARCTVRVEQRVVTDAGVEWVPSSDPRLIGMVEEYTNELQTSDELIRHHGWHYQVAGEMVQSQRDGQSGVQWGIHSYAAVVWNKPVAGQCIIRTVPDGKVEEGTAFQIPMEQVERFWIPDHEWSTYAWSPMSAAIDDLHRWRALARYAWRTAESAIAMNGMVWMPGEAFVAPPAEVQDDADAGDAGTPLSPLEQAYYEAVRMRLSENDDIAGVAPWLIHYDNDLKPPESVDIGRGLDEQGIAHRREALEDFARATNLPVTTVIGGGVGDANHWSEWLATDKVFASAVAPTMDRITHLDLTRTVLWPRLVVGGVAAGPELRNFRFGYDPAPVIVKPDRSDIALRALALGAIGYESARDAFGFDEDDKPSEDDIKLLLEVTRTRLTEQTTGIPVGPGNVQQQAPNNGVPPTAQPAAPPASNGNGTAPVAAQGAADGGSGGGGRDPFGRGVRTGNALLDRLTKLRSSLGTRLLASAQHAYEAALRQAGVRVKTRARSRMSNGARQQVERIVDEHQPLAPVLAAVGINELEMLRGSFDTFATQAVQEIERYQQRARDAITRAGLDPNAYMGEEPQAEQAVEFLVTGLNAMARRRLLEGDAALLAAVRAPLAGIPRARRPPEGGFDLPGLPNPEDLAAAAARLVRNALAVADGRAKFTAPATPDQLPEVVTLNVPTVEEAVAAEITVEPVWQWVHGFYGEPISEFEPHAALGEDGFTTTDREGDPGLANPDAWPPGDFYAPNDHDGCTCEWVPVEGAETDEGARLPGSEALAQAIAEVGV